MTSSYLTTVFGPSPTNLGLSWLSDEGMTSVFCPDVDALNRRVASLNGDASGIYVRMTTLTGPPARGRRGGVEMSASLPGLWADIDFDTVGHKHDPSKHRGLVLPPDEESARSIVELAHLPEPTVWVHSGGGLYPLWLLDEPLELQDDEARKMAANVSSRWQKVLASGAASAGWHYGSGVGDLTRVLRLPGTVNRKAGLERPCEVLSDDGPRYGMVALLDALEDAEMLSPAATVDEAPELTAEDRAGFDLADAGDDGGGVFQRLFRDVGIGGVLLAAGWAECGCDRSDCIEHYTRPGAPENPHSAHVIADNPHVLVVHSEETGLPSGAGQKLTAGRLFALLHHDGDESAAARDLADAERGLPASAAATALPGWAAASPTASLFDATPTLRHIRTAARSRLLSETAVLLNVLGLRACGIDCDRKLPATVASRADLNLVLGTVGESAAGKTAAFRVACELMGEQDTDLVRALGSGQGIAEQYMGNVLDDEGKKTRGPVPGLARLFLEDEVDAITAKGENASDAALGEIRKAYSGSHLGQSNATADRNRNIPGGSYRFVLVTNIQPGRSQGLLNDKQRHAGTPQRFVMLPAATVSGDELAALVESGGLPEWPGELDLPSTEFFDEDFVIPEHIANEIRLTYLRGRDDLDASLAGHRQLTKLKVAAVLADLHGGNEITDQWWGLAETVMLISDVQIERCRTALAAQRAKDNVEVGTALAYQQFETTRKRDELEDSEADEIREAVLEAVEGTDGVTRTELRQGLSARRRRRLREVLDEMVADGDIELVRLDTSGRPREVYR